VINWRL